MSEKPPRGKRIHLERSFDNDLSISKGEDIESSGAGSTPRDHERPVNIDADSELDRIEQMMLEIEKTVGGTDDIPEYITNALDDVRMNLAGYIVNIERNGLDLAKPYLTEYYKSLSEFEKLKEDLINQINKQIETVPSEETLIETNLNYSHENDQTPEEMRESLRQMVGEINEIGFNPILEKASGGKKSRRASTPKVEESSGKFAALAETSGVSKERNEMREAEGKYLAAYKDYYKDTNFLERSANKINDFFDKNGETENLAKLKDEYDQSRLVYADALEIASKEDPKYSASFDERMQNRYQKLEERYQKMKEEGTLPHGENEKRITLDAYIANAYAERQERVGNYIRFREVIRPAAQKKIEARTEALNEKGRNTFEKSLTWVAKQNQKLDKALGKNGARAVRVLASTIIAGGVAGGAALIAGGLGTVSLFAIAGWGTVKFSKALLGSFAGGAGGVATGSLYERGIGRGAQKSAKKNLKTLGRNEKLDLEQLKALDKKREKLTSRADEATLQKKKAGITALTAFIIGGISSLELSHIQSVQDALDALHHVSPEQMKGFLENKQDYMSLHQETPAELHAFAAEHPHPTASAPAAHEAPTPAPAAAPQPESFPPVSISHAGEGADKLIADLQHGLQGHHSPIVDALINAKNHSPDHLAHVLGFPKDNSEGYMRLGDSLEVKGHDLLFHHNGQTVVLMHEHADGSVTVEHHAQEIMSKPHVVEHHAHHATAHANETSPAPTSSASTELPAGMDPNSAAAADYLTAHHNVAPSVESHTPVAPSHSPEAPNTTSPAATSEPGTPEHAPEAPAQTFEPAHYNHFHTWVDSSKASIYQDAKGHALAFGGKTQAETMAFAQEQAAKLKTPIFFDSAFKDSSGEMLHVISVYRPDGLIDANWNAIHPTDSIAVPSAEDFVKKLS